jgi:nicotinamidase-related amidase
MANQIGIQIVKSQKEVVLAGPEDIAETYVTPENIDEELRGWMEEVRPYRWRKIDPVCRNDAGLLVVDMTKPFVEDPRRPLCSPNARAIVRRVAGVVDAFRAAGRPVIWIVQGHHSVEHDRGEHLSSWWFLPLLEGTDDVEMASGLEVMSDKVIVKRRYSGFYQTDLECTLRCLAVRQVVICGVLTHVCPHATAVDAFMRDFTVYYPADCTASLNRTLHVTALQSVAGWCGHIVSAREIVKWLSVRAP